jgi:hypothetical protein
MHDHPVNGRKIRRPKIGTTVYELGAWERSLPRRAVSRADLVWLIAIGQPVIQTHPQPDADVRTP